MVANRLREINAIVENIPGVIIVKQFELFDEVTKGYISVFTEGLIKAIEFEVEIYSQYPFKWHDSETIKFINSDLSAYKHIMEDGSICIHTAHSPVLSQKLNYDIQAVISWIEKYYINKDSDHHYEHLIVPQKKFKDTLFAYFFNEIDYQFSKNQFGYLDYSNLSQGLFHKEKCSNAIIQKFYSRDRKELVDVKWNIQFKALEKHVGLFIFIKDIPSINQRWIYAKWEDFVDILPQEFLNFLHFVEDRHKKSNGTHLPLFIGYNISEAEIHWQAIMLEIGKFPIFGQKINQQWTSKLHEERAIDWAMTRNCSYKYFFGRGHLCEKITQSKILIIGIGAIGSIVAKTFARSGCTKLDFVDFDVKEPENVSRSEYSFVSGLNNKTNDLINELFMISPFFEPSQGGYEFSEAFNYFLKSNLTNNQNKSEMEKFINSYDIVIDCTADNDLLYILSQLNMTTSLINVSISNHAKQLVCATEQNRYEFVSTQFNGKVLEFDVEDLYNPTGCWSPTFKASYNDINTLVQFALKHINLKFKQERQLRNFVLETEEEGSFNINLKEF
ncbi:MAG TPA: thiamine biosynthesis protein ThiF [Prolixibacteraceae bacterium]|nr:thiamine biosynthesis protein ThiF [Prolixibacteraceae bacterium]